MVSMTLPQTKKNRWAPMVALLSVVFAIVCSPELARTQSNGSGQVPIQSNHEPSTLSGPYLAWLAEDVRWIISPDERAAYLSLPSNESRMQFIQDFWQKRNRAAQSKEIAFKDEHYRRVAFANKRFAAGQAGWMTDRGRIYIIYGKPDSIESRRQTVLSIPDLPKCGTIKHSTTSSPMGRVESGMKQASNL